MSDLEQGIAYLRLPVEQHLAALKRQARLCSPYAREGRPSWSACSRRKAPGKAMGKAGRENAPGGLQGLPVAV